MTTDRLITLAIHTFEKAQPIKQLLEREGISVELNNVNLAAPAISPGVRIRIHESDLPLALRIVENIEIFEIPAPEGSKQKGGEVLAPVDFSPLSDKAVKLAFLIAAKTGMSVKLLHSFIAPVTSPVLEVPDNEDYSVADMEQMQTLKEATEKMMNEYAAKLRRWILDGVIPAAKYSSLVMEGIPEESILQYAREKQPNLIIMGTRGTEKKEAELIGSVTAEVLDSCRIPAFTVPENADIDSLIKVKKVAFLCNLDQEDMIALDTLYRLFSDQNLEVCLVHIPGKRDSGADSRKVDSARLNLLRYCRESYPRYSFDMRTVELDTLIDDFSRIIGKIQFQLICVPNKKRSVFARLFNPSVAHKILFRADVAMMVIPV